MGFALLYPSYSSGSTDGVDIGLYFSVLVLVTQG
jgi:hypothetical protein